MTGRVGAILKNEGDFGLKSVVLEDFACQSVREYIIMRQLVVQINLPTKASHGIHDRIFTF